MAVGSLTEPESYAKHIATTDRALGKTWMLLDGAERRRLVQALQQELAENGTNKVVAQKIRDAIDVLQARLDAPFCSSMAAERPNGVITTDTPALSVFRSVWSVKTEAMRQQAFDNLSQNDKKLFTKGADKLLDRDIPHNFVCPLNCKFGDSCGTPIAKFKEALPCKELFNEAETYNAHLSSAAEKYLKRWRPDLKKSKQTSDTDSNSDEGNGSQETNNNEKEKASQETTQTFFDPGNEAKGDNKQETSKQAA